MLGELIADPLSHAFGMDMKQRLDRFFVATNGDNSEAVSDDMNMAMMASMLLRNVLTFGLISEDKLNTQLDKLLHSNFS